jgi:hypothetical protein
LNLTPDHVLSATRSQEGRTQVMARIKTNVQLGGAVGEADQEDWSSFGQADRSERGSEDKTTVPEIVSPPVQGLCSIVPEQTS